MGMTFKRKYRSSLKVPFSISLSRSLLLAANTRTSTLSVRVPPTRSNFFSCKMRRILAWVFRLMSPISSKKMVPLSATSNLPRFLVVAPVKAPFSWPNSSLSISSSGMAAQFTSMRGLSGRSLIWWMVRATSSLPVPFSPVIRTQAWVGAAMAICFFRAWMGGLFPVIECFSRVFLRKKRFSSSRRRKLRALLMVTTTFSMESGFSTK